MVEGGMPPVECIKAATVVNAEVLGMKDQIGAIETGKLADIIAVDGKPVTRHQNPATGEIVMKDGKVYKQ